MNVIRFAQVWLTVAILGLTLEAPVLAGEARHRIVTIGTGSPSGTYFTVGQAICEAVNRDAARRKSEGELLVLACTAGPSGGSAFNIRQVAHGAFTFAIAQSNDQRAAHAGGGSNRVPSVPALRSVLSLHAEAMHLMVRADSPITTVAALSGRRLALGNRGSGTRVLAELLMNGHGLGADTFESVESMTMEVQSRALCLGQIDAFAVVTAIPASGVRSAARTCGARLLALDTEVERTLVAQSNDLTRVLLPGRTYPTQDDPLSTIGVRAGLVTRDLVPDDVVADLVSAVMRHLPLLRAAHPALAALDPGDMARNGHGAPLHRGAATYYAKRGWQ